MKNLIYIQAPSNRGKTEGSVASAPNSPQDTIFS